MGSSFGRLVITPGDYIHIGFVAIQAKVGTDRRIDVGDRAGIRGYPSVMDPIIKDAIPVLPAADTTESLNWWTEICGFKETVRDATPPNYAGINRGEAYLHIAGMSDKELARKVGDQTMVRIAVQGIESMYAEYQKRGGKVHPNGPLQSKPWGTKEFGAIDPMACA